MNDNKIKALFAQVREDKIEDERQAAQPQCHRCSKPISAHENSGGCDCSPTQRQADAIIKSLKLLNLGVGLTTADWANLTSTAEQYIQRGWSSYDVRSFLRCTEELNPELDELTALGRMASISSKYPRSKK
jgi:hypothetical protein